GTNRRGPWGAGPAAESPAWIRRYPARRSVEIQVRVADRMASSPRYGLHMGLEKGGVYESVTVETKDQVAQVTLIGPGKGNAMGPAFWSEMPELFAALDADRDVRAIVITGSGNNFSYGLDVPAMGGTFAPLMADGALARARTEFHAEVLRMQKAINAVADCRTPTIASVHGWCIGGAVDLISAVDIRYASTDAKFSVGAVKLANNADVGSLARLPLILNDG